MDVDKNTLISVFFRYSITTLNATANYTVSQKAATFMF